MLAEVLAAAVRENPIGDAVLLDGVAETGQNIMRILLLINFTGDHQPGGIVDDDGRIQLLGLAIFRLRQDQQVF